MPNLFRLTDQIQPTTYLRSHCQQEISFTGQSSPYSSGHLFIDKELREAIHETRSPGRVDTLKFSGVCSGTKVRKAKVSCSLVRWWSRDNEFAIKLSFAASRESNRVPSSLLLTSLKPPHVSGSFLKRKYCGATRVQTKSRFTLVSSVAIYNP